MPNLNSLLAKVATVFNTNPTTNDITQLKAVNLARGTPTATFVPVAQADGTVLWAAQSGGGGGGAFSSATSVWSSGSASKNAYTAPSVVNNLGIIITLTAASGTGQATNCTVTLNGVALTNMYTSTGTFPTLTITIPFGDLNNNPIETDPTVSVAVRGTYAGGNFNIANAGTLTNVQPIPFSASLSATFSPASVPFYTSTGTVNFAYSSVGTATTYAGIIGSTPTGNTASGSLTGFAVPSAAVAISGTVTGDGQFGADTGVVYNLSGSMAAPSTFIPAFYAQTTTSTPPAFTTASSATTGAAAGSTITYGLPAASSNYNWICTQRPLANLMLQSPFGSSVLIPDVTAPTQTISGQVFSVYGWTGLSLVSASVLVIS